MTLFEKLIEMGYSPDEAEFIIFVIDSAWKIADIFVANRIKFDS